MESGGAVNRIASCGGGVPEASHLPPKYTLSLRTSPQAGVAIPRIFYCTPVFRIPVGVANVRWFACPCLWRVYVLFLSRPLYLASVDLNLHPKRSKNVPIFAALAGAVQNPMVLAGGSRPSSTMWVYFIPPRPSPGIIRMRQIIARVRSALAAGPSRQKRGSGEPLPLGYLVRFQQLL